MSDAVWVKTEPAVDGSTYVVTVEATNDVAVTLDPERATRYAWGVLDAAHRAAYDAAVLKQMTRKLKLDLSAAGQLVTDLRNDRPDLDHGATAPLILEPGVTKTLKPFLKVSLSNGNVLGQWSFEDARQHALHVLESVKVADLDGAYHRALVGQVGIDSERARNVVDDVGSYRN